MIIIVVLPISSPNDTPKIGNVTGNPWLIIYIYIYICFLFELATKSLSFQSKITNIKWLDKSDCSECWLFDCY